MVSKEFHASRRRLYAELMEDDSVAFVFAENELPDKGDEFHPFTPYANFYYLTGFDEPKAVLKMTKRGGRVQEVLYIRRTDERMKRWLGVFSTKESVQAQTGIECVEYLDCFRDEVTLFGWPGSIKCVYVDMANWSGEDHLTQAQKFAAEIRMKYPDIPIRNTFKDLALIRQVKTDEEIAFHRRACDVTAEGVKCMLAHLRPGMYEYEAQAYFDFVLKKAKALADSIGGLNDEEAYKKVVADLDDADLTYAAMAADVAALNVVCRNAMTADFLSKASTGNPIDLTSFIENPNVYQAGGDNIQNGNPTKVDGWDIIQLSENNSPSVTSDLLGDSELYSGSWSANAGNNIGRGHYCTSVGNTEGINLPDGRYLLTAATFMTRGGETQKVRLYASLDNNEIEAYSNFNGDLTLYDAAAGHNDGKTTEVEIDVRGGKLYFGIKGNGEIVGGQGQHWIADNFRLYYIGGTPTSPLEIAVDDAGYATYYAPNAFTMPAGLTGGIAKSVDTGTSKLTIDWCYQPGNTVPALTGIILQGDKGKYTGEPSVAAATAPTRRRRRPFGRQRRISSPAITAGLLMRKKIRIPFDGYADQSFSAVRKAPAKPSPFHSPAAKREQNGACI